MNERGDCKNSDSVCASEFAIYKFNSEEHDPDECFFTSAEHVDGSQEGAVLADLESYGP